MNKKELIELFENHFKYKEKKDPNPDAVVYTMSEMLDYIYDWIGDFDLKDLIKFIKIKFLFILKTQYIFY